MAEQDYELLSKPLYGGVPIKGWTRGVPLEEQALDQLANVARMPFVFKHLAAMPDLHLGMGACVGSVIPTDGAVIPAATGADIGCGMMAVRTELTRDDVDEDEEDLYRLTKVAVPTGRSDQGGPRDVGGWDGFLFNGGRVPVEVERAWLGLNASYENIAAAHPALTRAKTVVHLGTLGTGNHFIEFAEDEEKRVWVVIHSGSRGIGARIGGYFTGLAKERCKQWYVDLPDPNLAYFPRGTKEYGEYLNAMNWAQKFAWTNRELMMERALGVLEYVAGKALGESKVVHCHHNYAAEEKHFGKKILVTRKGAINAAPGVAGIIPGSMGDRSFIVEGKGNREAFMSASHGAGRVMSRTQAKKEITVAAHEWATSGVYCDKTAEVLDESPAAYKDIEAVMTAQDSLIEVKHTLKAFVNVKGVSEPRRKKK